MFAHTSFKCLTSLQSVLIFKSSASQPLLADSGIDILPYEGLSHRAQLKVSLTYEEISRQILPEISLWCNQTFIHSISNNNANSIENSDSMENMNDSNSKNNEFFPNIQFKQFNVTLPLLEYASTHVSRLTCETSLSGAYQSVDESCLHFIRLKRVWFVPSTMKGCEYSHLNNENQNGKNDEDNVKENWQIGQYEAIPNPVTELTQLIHLGETEFKIALPYDDLRIRNLNRRRLFVQINTKNEEEYISNSSKKMEILRSNPSASSEEIRTVTKSADGLTIDEKSMNNSVFESLKSSLELTAKSTAESSTAESSTADSNSIDSTPLGSTSSTASSTATQPKETTYDFRVELTFRHENDPLLAALKLTHATYWFGLSRQSLLLLSFLLFICAVMLLLPPLLSAIVSRNQDRNPNRSRTRSGSMNDSQTVRLINNEMDSSSQQ